MLTKHANIAMIGAGAIGGVTAALIRQNGSELELACNHHDTPDKISNQGLRINGRLPARKAYSSEGG